MKTLLTIILVFYWSWTLSQDTNIYRFDKKLDYGIAATSLGTALLDYTLYNNLETLDSETIASLDRQDIFSLDRRATNQNSESASKLSDVFEFGVFALPAPFIFSSRMRKETKVIAVMYAETFTLNLLSTSLVKFVSKRNRPFVYNPEVSLSTKMRKNARMSFYSGHTSHTAAMSFFSAKVFSDFYPDSKWKPLVWTTAFAIPAFTGYLRYKAGKHYPTDVIAGITMGGLIGYFVPHLHKVKPKLPSNLSIDVGGGGIRLGYGF